MSDEERNKRLRAGLEAIEARFAIRNARILARLNKDPEEVLRLARDFLVDVPWKQPRQIDLPTVTLDPNNIHLNATTSALKATPGDRDRPAMLFYKLFDEDQPLSKGISLADPQWVDQSTQHHLLVLGPSGCGKTRKLFELLLKKKGYYLVPRTTSADEHNYGSRALTTALDVQTLNDLNLGSFWTENTTEHGFETRRKAVEFAVRCVLLAYAMIYRVWTEWAARDAGPTFEGITSKSWLLVQLFPEYFLGKDYFELLTAKLMKEIPIDYIPSPKLFPDGFLCAIDEAQVLGCAMPDFFMSNNSRRSLLFPVLSAASGALSRGIILSGIALSILEPGTWNAVMSSMANQGEVAGRFIFSEFETLSPEDVESLIHRLTFCDQTENLSMVAAWLTGRPRFAASFIEEILWKGLRATEHLDSYVEHMTKAVRPPQRTPGWYLDMLASKSVALELGGVRDFNLYHQFLMDSHGISYGKVKMNSNASLLELGLGDVPTPDSNQFVKEIAGDAALILEAARQRRALNRSEEFLVAKLVEVSHWPEEVMDRIPYVLAEQFSSALFGPGSELQNRSVFADFSLPEFMHGHWDVPPWICGRVGLTDKNDRVESRTEFYQWMETALDPGNDSVLRMRFPSDSVGPDIVLALRNAAYTKVLVGLIQVKCDLKEALLRVDPALINHSNRGKAGQAVKSTAIRHEHSSFLHRLVNPVLRVVVSCKAPHSTSVRTELIPYTRGGKSGHDVCLVLDQRQNDFVFGKVISNLLSRIKW